eukprot:scaffold189716_cov28-Tisochrysis_lutea.AAC.4
MRVNRERLGEVLTHGYAGPQRVSDSRSFRRRRLPHPTVARRQGPVPDRRGNESMPSPLLERSISYLIRRVDGVEG